MSAPAKLAAFAAVLALLLGGGALAGAALGPDRSGDDDPESRATTADAGHGHAGESAPAADAHAEPEAEAEAEAPAGDGHGGHEAAADAVRGLSVADGPLRLELDTPELPRDASAPLRFRVVDGGAVVRDFDVEHARRMHLIVVRRDLTGFQHLHPRQRADGSWETEARLPDAGTYRVFADFSHEGEATTLATDLRVDGAADLQPLPAPATTARDGAYEARLEGGHVHAGEAAALRFDITRDGRPVEVQPYLGARGHLVALREGDLAFLHVHPETGGDGVRFAATFPTEGRYRLFLQVRHDDVVRTFPFTLEVGR